MAKNGAKVVLGTRREELLQNLVGKITSKGGESVFAVTDVRKQNDLTNLVNLAVERYGRLDVIVNNAGVSQLIRIDDLDIDGWEEMIDINLKGVLYGMAAAIPAFKNQQSVHIRERFHRRLAVGQITQ